MHQHSWVFAGLALWLCAGLPVTAGEAAKAPNKAEIAELISKLSTNADAAIRDTAAAKLLESGEAAVPALMAAKSRASGAQAIERIGKVLEKIVGPTVAGVCVSLSADKKRLKLGEKLTFSLTFFNTNAQEVNMPLGYHATTVSLTTAPWDSIRAVSGIGKDRKVTEQMYVGPSEVCGFGSGPDFKTIPAHQANRVRVDAAYRDGYMDYSFVLYGRDLSNPEEEKKARVDGVLNLTVGANSVMPFKKPGTYRLMYYKKSGEDEAKHPVKHVDGNKDAACWSGVIYSNEIEITLEPPEVKK